LILAPCHATRKTIFSIQPHVTIDWTQNGRDQSQCYTDPKDDFPHQRQLLPFLAVFIIVIVTSAVTKKEKALTTTKATESFTACSYGSCTTASSFRQCHAA
jgi:hypothetical protein